MGYYFKHRDYTNPELDNERYMIHSRYYGPFGTEVEAAVFYSLHANTSILASYGAISEISTEDKKYMIDNPQEAVGARKISFLHPSEAGYYVRTYDEWKRIFDAKGHKWFM